MEADAGIFTTLIFPPAAFVSSISLVSDDGDTSVPCVAPPWSHSLLNPKNRVETLSALTSSMWRIDGCDASGTRLLTVPSFLIGKPPLRVDTYIPDAYRYPPSLRDTLDPAALLLVKGMRVADLDISRHILRALNHWSRNYPHFEDTYWNLPVGSRIVVHNVVARVQEMAISIVPGHDVEQQMFSVAALREMWKLADNKWPPSISIEDLRFVRQLHENIALVYLSLPNCKPPKPSSPFVFKLLGGNLKYHYHELKLLLTMDPHENVVSPPKYLVTRQCRFGGKQGVCGFILEYFPGGTLSNRLSNASEHEFPSREQFRCAKEITVALMHINKSGPGYYSDLKLNNIMFASRPGAEERERIVLVDFEQRGSWLTWSPPEVYYVQYLEYICESKLESSIKAKYLGLMRDYLPGWKPETRTSRYRPDVQGYSGAWIALSKAEKESAQVYMLGKVLWCIFEMRDGLNTSMNVETFADRSDGIRFPEFRHTPLILRDCIAKWTSGAPEWEGNYLKLVRIGRKLYPLKTVDEKDQITAAEVQQMATSWWQAELATMEAYVKARIALRASNATNTGMLQGAEALKVGLVPARPTLQDVLSMLDEAEVAVMQ